MAPRTPRRFDDPAPRALDPHDFPGAPTPDRLDDLGRDELLTRLDALGADTDRLRGLGREQLVEFLRCLSDPEAREYAALERHVARFSDDDFEALGTDKRKWLEGCRELIRHGATALDLIG
jgi:hypothetical protein